MTHADLPLRVTERFPLPDGRRGVSTWWASDPEQLEQQLRTRAGHGHPEREPPRRLHRCPPGVLLIEERVGDALRPVAPELLARTDRRWHRALLRSRRADWLRRMIGPRDLASTEAPAAASRWVESADRRHPPG
ncbi:hypothetical protein [Rathayibacter tanaceti]|uniref:Uncharacterized protein n=1 Tax=Rathayibacter tanaceti TaxID=1671680 RepID=A0AAE6V590_9MICO|nr:hypothetical protein [Rathayibacter tanaceti]QHC54618.1 hypothetical protein GSU10_02410 [Rathayibacter tanaceti]